MSLPPIYSHGLFATVVAIVLASNLLRWAGGMTQVVGYYVTVCAAMVLTLYAAHAGPPLEPIRRRRVLTIAAVLVIMSMVSSYPPG